MIFLLSERKAKAVLPVAESPHIIVLVPLLFNVQAAWRVRIFFLGNTYCKILKTDFFISPANWVPKMTIFCWLKFKDVIMLEVAPGMFLDMAISPALKIWMSTPFEKSYSNSWVVGLISILRMKRAW